MDTSLDLSPYLSTNSRKTKRVLPFKCDQCEYSARHQCQLKNHAKVHLDLKPLACPIPGCSYTTKWKHSLANHKTLVHEDESTVWYKCEKCDFKTKYKYVLEKRHARLHSEGPIIRRYKCDVCDYTNDSRPSFLEHRKNHNEDVKPLTCDYEGCEYATRWKCSMFQHKKRYHSTEVVWFKCDQCNYKTKDKSVLRLHAAVHTEERPFSCPHPGCDFKGKTVTSIRNHQIRLDHFVTSDGQICEKPTRKRFQCTLSGCKFTSNDSGDLTKHLKIHDPNRKRSFECPLCGKSFFDTAGLRAHVRYHTYDKSFLCSFPNCKYKSIYPSEVKKHERVHVAVKMFACTSEGCEAKFKTASDLKKHLLCHDPEGRPTYVCNLCSLEFVTRCGLRNHISLHTNEKAYKCDECGYATAKSYEFKRHKCAIECTAEGVKMKKNSVKRGVPVSQNVFLQADGSFGCRRCTFTSKSQFGVAAHAGWAHSKNGPRKLKRGKSEARTGR